jgi:hypothetical protein
MRMYAHILVSNDAEMKSTKCTMNDIDLAIIQLHTETLF